MTDDKIPITFRALMQRLNRRLAPIGRKLVANRGAVARASMGAFCLIDERTTNVICSYKDLDAIERIGRTMGAIKDYERLAR